jgi:poly-beta-hydroxybutyrate-responsive repressor
MRIEDMGKTQDIHTGPELGRFPKNFLASWLLLLLRNWSAHGYQLIQTLMLMGLGAVDPATVYRTLRQLESEGLISSVWDPQASGAARRMYTLTPNGEEYLSVWAHQLEQYQNVLNRFFDLYAANITDTTEKKERE